METSYFTKIFTWKKISNIYKERTIKINKEAKGQEKN